MHWILAVIGALVGAVVGVELDRDGLLPGAFVFAAIGWLLARVAQLHARLQALERGAERHAAGPATALADADASAARASRFPAADPSPAAHGQASAPAAMPSAAAGQPQPAATAPGHATYSVAAPAPPAAAAAAASSPPRSGTVPAPARSTPGLGQRLGRLLRRWLMEGNVAARVGVLVVFVAVAALLKLASDAGYFSVPIELRLLGVALAAVAAAAWGWRNRSVRPAFGLSLQGMGIGLLLLTVFAAYRLYAVVPAGMAFALVLVLVATAAMLAVLQHSVWLALLGLIGGYLAPVLISTGSGNHVALFAYYALLNAAVLGVAWVRPWRALNLVAFGFTFGVGTLWGARYYQPDMLASTEPFLVLFFAFFVAIPVLYALRQAPVKRGLVDGTLVFGTPLVAFPLQAVMLEGRPMLLAYVALAVALLYALLAAWLLRVRRLPLLGQSFAVLSIGFATLAVPLALSARWTSASWALEGAALVWLGLRQRQRLPQLAGWVLQLLAAIAWLHAVVDGSSGWGADSGEWALLNGHALGMLMMAAAALFISACHDRAGHNRWLVWPPFLGGLLWWHVGGLREVDVHGGVDERHGMLALLAVTIALAGLLRGALRWPRLGWVVVLDILAAVPFALAALDAGDGALRVPAAPYWAGLLLAMLAGLACLRTPQQKGISIAHIGALWVVALVAGALLHHDATRLQGLGSGWQLAGLVLPLGALLWASWRVPGAAAWPLADRFWHYRWRWWAPALALLAVLWVQGLVQSAGTAPLPFVPLLNPLELLQLAGLLLAARIATRPTLQRGQRQLLQVLVPLAAFAFATMAGLRAVHHWGGAPWSESILASATAQTTLTVVWSVLGVAAWVAGSRRRMFPVWLAGAVLMGLVLVKLVLVDRQHMGNLTGIISFLTVGLLLVLVGRIAPTPPRSTPAVAPA